MCEIKDRLGHYKEGVMAMKVIKQDRSVSWGRKG